MHLLTSWRFLQKVCSYKNVSSSPMYEHVPVFKAGLSSSYDGWAKCKEKVPDVSDTNENIKTTRNSKFKFT